MADRPEGESDDEDAKDLSLRPDMQAETRGLRCGLFKRGFQSENTNLQWAQGVAAQTDLMQGRISASNIRIKLFRSALRERRLYAIDLIRT